jgi:hypothetical protein
LTIPPEGPTDADIDDASGFDTLLVSAVKCLPDQSTRPTTSALLAYLAGNPSAAQIAEVQDALIHSASFRREFTEIAKEYEFLTSATAAQLFDEASSDAPPPRWRFRLERAVHTWVPWFSGTILIRRFTHPSWLLVAGSVTVMAILGVPAYRGLIVLPRTTSALATSERVRRESENEADRWRATADQQRREILDLSSRPPGPSGISRGSVQVAQAPSTAPPSVIATLQDRIHELEKRNAALSEQAGRPPSESEVTVATLTGTSVLIALGSGTDKVRGAAHVVAGTPTVQPARRADVYILAFTPFIPNHLDSKAVLALELTAADGRVVARETTGVAELRKSLDEGPGWEILGVPREQAAPGEYGIRLVQVNPAVVKPLWEQRFVLADAPGETERP